MTISFTNLQRAQTCLFCRVSQRAGARGSAAAAAADSDGKRDMFVEYTI